MTYEELIKIADAAWEEFFNILEKHGVDADEVSDRMSAKDCYNDVWDCIVQSAELECEDE